MTTNASPPRYIVGSLLGGYTLTVLDTDSEWVRFHTRTKIGAKVLAAQWYQYLRENKDHPANVS